MTEQEFKDLDSYKSKPVKFAHDFIFSDLPKETPDHFGRLIRESDPPGQRWLQWQKSVQKAENVPKEVMDYFQKTKHLVKPPAKRDLNIQQTRPLNMFTPLRFTWSPSKLMTFETCPMKFAAESYYKTVPYSETVQSIWGTRVHQAAEDFFNGKTPEPEAFKMVESYCKLLDKLPGERLVEHKISLTADWKPAVWGSGDESLRCILDLGFKHEDTLRCYDWKTGKVKDDPIQMQIYCYALAILYPDVQKFDFRYIWLKEKTTTGFQIERKDILPIAKDVRARVARMKEAWDNENFTMRKNGLCRQYCGATECPNCGGGR